MKWPCEVCVNRLEKRANPVNVKALLADFMTIPSSVSDKEARSMLLAEQLHYETDDECSDGGSAWGTGVRATGRGRVSVVLNYS